MSLDIDASEVQATSALPQHSWLKKLVGEWKTVQEYDPGTGELMRTEGRETAKMFGDLWVISEGESTMPDGNVMLSKFGLGYDVTFQEYRSFWIATASSHLWKYTGVLSEDEQTMTLTCEGPDMMGDGPTATYQDVIQFQDENHREHRSSVKMPDGTWLEMMKICYSRV